MHYLTLEEAAEYCRYSRSGFYKLVAHSSALVAAGFPPKIKFARPGRKFLFRQEWLDEFLAPKEPEIPYVRPKRQPPRIVKEVEFGKNWEILMR